MTAFRAALWAEMLKARRSLVPWLAGLGFCLAPLAGGLFMWILKDPERAKSMGLISAKAQLTVGGGGLAGPDGAAVAGRRGGRRAHLRVHDRLGLRPRVRGSYSEGVVSAADPAGAIVGAKLVVIGLWAVLVMAFAFGLGLLMGAAVGLPDGSTELLWRSAGNFTATGLLALALLTPVALFAGIGHGYLPPLGWALLTVAFAQIAVATGWGDWFPWAVPAMVSQAGGPRPAQLGLHSYIVVAVVSVAGLVATLIWWRRADQTR